MFFVAPLCKREARRFTVTSTMMMVVVMFAFSLFGAAVFAEPTVTQVEEVSRLVHGLKELCALIFIPGFLFRERTKARYKAQSLSCVTQTG